MTGKEPKSPDDGRLGQPIRRDDLIQRLSTEFWDAGKLPLGDRVKGRIGIARVLRDLYRDADDEKMLDNIKTHFLDIYERLMRDDR
jgi:hypothetical protein